MLSRKNLRIGSVKPILQSPVSTRVDALVKTKRLGKRNLLNPYRSCRNNWRLRQLPSPFKVGGRGKGYHPLDLQGIRPTDRHIAPKTTFLGN